MTRDTVASLLTCLAFAITARGFAQAQTRRPFTTLDVPGAIHTEAYDTDDVNIVGFYVDSRNVEHGFKQTPGKFTTFNFPGATGTRAYGIDVNDQFIVGTYTDPHFTPHGFRLDNSGKYTTVDVPGASGPVPAA